MTSDRIRLITWNIRWGRGIDDIVDLDRTVGDLMNFSECDILCLQEVAAGYTDPLLKNTDGSNQFESLASRFPGYTAVTGYAVDQLGPSGARQQFGNMILSRFPVLQVYRHRLPWPAEAGIRSMQRMALETILETPLGILRIITTHLEFYSAGQRMTQIEYLRWIHQESSTHALMTERIENGAFSPYAKTVGTILAGDFNFAEDSAERSRLLTRMDNTAPAFVDAWEIAHPDQKHTPTIGWFNRDRWPDGPFVSDYIFVSEDLASSVRAVRVETDSQASDHQALLLELA